MSNCFLAVRFQAASALTTLLIVSGARGQVITPPASQQRPQPRGEVIFQRQTKVLPQEANQNAVAPISPATGIPEVTDTERDALRFSDYDLDIRLIPATSRLSARARLTIRNEGSTPLLHLPLQISSALLWESVTLIDEDTRSRLPLAQHLLETDADHTGKASEAVITLPTPLVGGASMVLDTFYSGAIAKSAARLERIGASKSEAEKADWDSISTDFTGLRGFGNVLWYPVASPQIFLGQGAQLFESVGQAKLRGSTATVHLRLSVEYIGDAPAAAYFCGHRKPLNPVSDNAEVPIISSPGLATAEFASSRIGFRALSLFLSESPEILLPPVKNAASSDPSLAVETLNEEQLPLLTANARDAAVVLHEWLNLQPLSSLAIIDHPGQPFEDGPLLIAPLSALTAADAGPALTHSLTHAWIQTGIAWMDEGLAQFFVLLALERTKGREAAEAQLSALLQPLSIAEIAPTKEKPGTAGRPLTAATTEMYYRRKAAAVWWMLRNIAGDDALKPVLEAWRTRVASRNNPEQEALVFEADLEKSSDKDLHWFFEDWILHDRGLPDLSFVEVSPRELVASNGRANGWVTAVTVRNDGAAVADVPLVIRAGSLSTTARIRVPAFSTVTQRVLIEAAPTEVILNDGTTPEQRSSVHTRTINIHGRS